MFTSSEKDRKKAYAEFLRNGEKRDPPDIHQETHIAFLRASHPHLVHNISEFPDVPTTGDTNLFGRPFIPIEKRKFHPQTTDDTDLFTPPDKKKWLATKEALEKRLTTKELNNKNEEAVIKKRKTPILLE